MATLEMVEKLVDRANVSYDEAKTALEAAGDDLLEAMIYLERMGKVGGPRNGGFYSTRMQVVPGGNSGSGDAYSAGEQHHGESFGQLMGRLWKWARGIIDKGNANSFEVVRREERVLKIPVTVLVLLLVFCFYFTLPLLLVGLFFGFHYRFRGPELEESVVNNVMDGAAKVADNLKTEVKGAVFHEKSEDGEDAGQ